MKRITLLFFVFITQFVFAQFTSDDVEFYVGEGDQTAYMVIDFKDGTDDRSYAWGFRYNTNDAPTMVDILEGIANEEPGFEVDHAGGAYLNDIIYNSHSGIDSDPDWWSIWQGTSSETFGTNGGIGVTVENEMWYGCSYGITNPTAEAPVTPIPAYSSLWLNHDDIENWIGSGSNQSLVLVDFGTTTNEVKDSFVFGIQYDGSLSAEEALEMIENHTDYFSFNATSTAVTEVQLGDYSSGNASDEQWKHFTGTNLSNWQTATDLSEIQLNGEAWFGLSFSDRRPFTPQEAETLLSSKGFASSDFSVYPNPAASHVVIDTNETIEQITIFDMTGKMVLNTKNKHLNISHFNTGVYQVRIKTTTGIAFKKLIKK